MSKTLVAHEQPISKIFSDDYVFHIPGYQRPYAWTNEEARELFDDIFGFMRANPGSIDEMPPYFLGSIVLIKGDAPNAEVVDGQQRLTTLTILLASIRTNVSREFSESITSLLYERGNPIRGTQDRYRLTLRERDRGFFQKYIQSDDGIEKLAALQDELKDSQDNIRSNAKLYLKLLKDIPEKDCVEFAQFVARRCYLVMVATPDLDSAYRIFSVLNTRGLDLTPTDILKAEILGAIADKQRDEYTKKWENAEETVGRGAFSDLFSHIRMIYRKAKPKGTLIKEFKEHVTEAGQPIKFIDSVLLPMVDAFDDLHDASYESIAYAEKINEYLKWLNRLDFTDWMPPAIAYLVRYRQQPNELLNFFRDLERLAYGLLIMRASINDRIDRFSKLTQAIENESDLSTSPSMQLTPNEQYDIYSQLNGDIYYDLPKARLPILLRLDALLSGGGASYDFSIISIEHVLPQTPPNGSQWLTWFPTIEDRLRWMHRLGNLVLLTRRKNSSASNYDFAIKKNTYFKKGGVSPFALTTQVIECEEWTPEVVADCQSKRMKILEEHWRLQDRMARKA